MTYLRVVFYSGQVARHNVETPKLPHSQACGASDSVHEVLVLISDQ